VIGYRTTAASAGIVVIARGLLQRFMLGLLHDLGQGRGVWHRPGILRLRLCGVARTDSMLKGLRNARHSSAPGDRLEKRVVGPSLRNAQEVPKVV
jgi:hypothetical protein